MTMYEMNFSLLVEDTLKNIVLPEYRQIIVEARSPSPAAPEHRQKTVVALSEIARMCISDSLFSPSALGAVADGGVHSPGEEPRAGVQ